MKKAAKEELISFDALVRVGEDGKAEEVVFGPETEVARCVAPDFQDAHLPAAAEALLVGQGRGSAQVARLK